MNVVVVGGGFGGVKTAIELAKRGIAQVTLISDHSYFLHHATLYSTATGSDLGESVIPLKDMVAEYPAITVVRDEAVSIDIDSQKLIGKKKQYKYDELVLALGVVNNFLHIKGMDKYSFGIKSLKELEKFHEGFLENITHDRKKDHHYAVIGAGATGVELIGALSEYADYLADTHHLDRQSIKFTLIEAADRVLPMFSKTASRKVKKQLEKMGIEVLLNTRVEALSKTTITTNTGKVPTTMAVWTSATSNHPFFAEQGDIFKLAPRGGRVEVNQYMEAAPHIYVIGDNAATPQSGFATGAIADAIFVASHLIRKYTHRPLKARVHRSFPASVPVAKRWAYAEYAGVYVAGFFGAWTRRILELSNYLRFMPLKLSLRAWKYHGKLRKTRTLFKEQ